MCVCVFPGFVSVSVCVRVHFLFVSPQLQRMDIRYIDTELQEVTAKLVELGKDLLAVRSRKEDLPARLQNASIKGIRSQIEDLKILQDILITNKTAASLLSVRNTTSRPVVSAKLATPPKANSSDVTKLTSLRDIMERMIQSKIVVRLGNDSFYDANLDLAAALGSPDMFLRQVPTEICETVVLSKVNEIQEKIALKSLLQSKLESTGQQALQENSELLEGIDTSSVTGSSAGAVTTGLYFKPRCIGHTNHVYTLAAKVDFCSKHGPLFMELKNSGESEGSDMTNPCYDVLQQALWRLYVLRSSNALVKMAVVLASTGRSAWRISFIRDLDRFQKNDGNSFECVTIARIEHADIWQNWNGYSNLFKIDPDSYLTADAVHLTKALACIGDPFSCISQLVACSNHRVYGISIPRMFSENRNGKIVSIIGATVEKYDVCIKVIGDERFAHEAVATLAVGTAYHEMHPFSRYYVLGVVSSYADPLECFEQLDINPAPVEPPAKSPALDRKESTFIEAGSEFKANVISALIPPAVLQRRNLSTRRLLPWMDRVCSPERWAQGGSIVMMPGEPVELDESNIMTWMKCVHRDLEVIHSAKYCHCDIRPSNVLKFGDTFHLIDFDLSVPIGGTVVFSKGGQFDYRPTSFLSVSCGEEVTWDEKHDYTMVTMVIAKKALFLGKNRAR
jgi:hypothetical protein